MGTLQTEDGCRIAYADCPLCASREIATLLSADCTRHPLYHGTLPRLMTWKKCSGCEHVFTDGYFTEAAAAVVFSKVNEHQQVGYDVERQRHVSARMVEKVLPFVDHGNWLDIGFGNASLLFTAQEYGFVPVGLDLRKDNVTRLQELGIDARCQDVNTLNEDGRYSVISMADVLEHVPWPRVCLQSVHRLLNADGCVFVSMPNSESMAWQSLDRSGTNPYWGELEHYHNFSRARLYSLLRECGFEPVRYGVSERYRCCMEVVARKVR